MAETQIEGMVSQKSGILTVRRSDIIARKSLRVFYFPYAGINVRRKFYFSFLKSTQFA